jgi:hypothetical protein
VKKTLPNDVNGDAIRRVSLDGADLAKPMAIDFTVAFQSQKEGIEFTRLLGKDFQVSLEADDVGEAWTCYCTKIMLLRYHSIVQVQRELDALAQPLGGTVDGWGTSGNADPETRN